MQQNTHTHTHTHRISFLFFIYVFEVHFLVFLWQEIPIIQNQYFFFFNQSVTGLVIKRIHLPMWEPWVQSLSREDPLEKEMAAHPSILAWKIPWTEKPRRLQFMGLQRVGCNWVTKHMGKHPSKAQVCEFLTTRFFYNCNSATILLILHRCLISSIKIKVTWNTDRLCLYQL